MKDQKKNIAAISLLTGALFVSPFLLAEEQNKVTNDKPAVTKTTDDTMKKSKSDISKEQQKTNEKAIKDKEKSQHDLLKKIHKGVSEGLKSAIKATKLIKDGKEKAAIEALEEATGKFNIALAADPKLALIPIDSNLAVTNLTTTPEVIKDQVNLAIDFLKDSKVQAARALLLPLHDDMISRTTSLPMTTYPDAIKLATKMLVEGKKEAALATLATALSTFVEETSVIPLSLLRAESMVQEASKLDKEKKKDSVLILLNGAEQQLQIATALGYTDKNGALYEELEKQIKVLKKEVTGGNVVENMYETFKKSIKDLINKKSVQTTAPKTETKQ